MLDLNKEPMNEMYEENQELKEKIEELVKMITGKNKELEEVKKEMNEMREEHRCELEGLDNMIWALFKRERQSNLEILKARGIVEAFMTGFIKLHGERFDVRIKKVGELKEKPFIDACSKRYNDKKAAEGLAKKLLQTWQENLKDPAWHPFKRVGTGEYMKEVVDEGDEKLKSLREEWGVEVMYAVKTALEEMNEVNPNGRDVFVEVWDFKRDRKVNLAQGILQMIIQYAMLPSNTQEKFNAGLKSEYEKSQMSERKRPKRV